MMGVMVSPLRGADGNVEFLAHLAVRPGSSFELGAHPALAERLDVPGLLAELDAPATPETSARRD